jgi:predicted SAM-dependent methyltransferase
MSLKSRVDSLLAGKPDRTELKLQLGCGHNILPDWINKDSTPSATAEYKPFPFADNIFAAVFCEHTIEHISKAQAFGMIAEVFRVLRPGWAIQDCNAIPGKFRPDGPGAKISLS